MSRSRRAILAVVTFASLAAGAFAADPVAKTSVKLKVYVQGVNVQGGNIGVMIFRDARGWPENNDDAYKAVVVPAHPGTVVVETNLPPGEYAIAVGHDVNLNRKVDRNWLGKPTEQWGMSNNPHARMKAPDFAKAKFMLERDAEIHIRMQ